MFPRACCFSSSSIGIDIKTYLILATIQQLGATGTALSIVAMAYTILHDYVIDSAEPLPRWAGPLGVAIISAVQAFDISLPNGIFHGANSYYGIAG